MTSLELTTVPAPECQPLNASADTRVVGLIGPATNRRLLIYAGAGISLDSGLPTGAELSREIHTRLTHLGITLPEVDPGDLLAVADAADARAGGLAALQAVACEAFPFTTATPSVAHRSLALLLLEGALQLLTSNWDTCIERAAPERISTVVTAADRMQIQADSLLKVHGSADREETLLVTSAQLARPPVWANAAKLVGETFPLA